MKKRRFVAIVCLAGVSVIALTLLFSRSSAVRGGNAWAFGSLPSLRSELLAAKDDQARLDIIKGVAGLREKGAAPFLMEYFQKLPLPQPSTNPYGDVFREKVLDAVLPVLGGPERDAFLSAVVRREAEGLRAAASYGAENKYPGGVWEKALGVLERDGASAGVWRELAAIADDRSVPEQLRVAVKTYLTRKDVGKDDRAIHKRIGAIIEKLPVRPMTCFIPYDIYYDKERRIAYAKSELYKEKNLEFARWRDSGKRAEYETGERVLLSYGVVSVREIVAALRREDVPKERRDCLAKLAASLLVKLSVNIKRKGEQMGEEYRLLAVSLASYVDQMEDPGAFSCRYDAERDLMYFFETTGMDKFHFSSGRQKREDTGEDRINQ